MWLQRHDFLPMVHESWDQPADGFGMLKFSIKLCRLKKVLPPWNTLTFGNVFSNIRLSKAQVKQLEDRHAQSHSDVDLCSLNLAQTQLLLHLAEEEDFWKQKARAKWLTDRDRNTRFFHASVTDKQAWLCISKIKDRNRRYITDQGEMQQHAVQFF